MPDILARRHAPTLAQFASSNVLLAFDYDGTLAPIAARPERVRLRERTRRLLATAATRYPCIVISGRKWSDITPRLEGIPLWHVYGNHGVEPWAQNAAHAATVRQWLGRLHHLRAYPGLAIEDKTYSVAVHYRHVRPRRGVRQAIEAAARRLPGTRVVGGKEAVNLVPASAPHKGIALEHARRVLACDCSIYVGDDETDEDAFAAAPAERLLSVRVGRRQSSAAAYYVRNQAAIDSLLRALVAARPLHDARAGALPLERGRRR
jgi:trehalose 6-phosphate phosphatase